MADPAVRGRFVWYELLTTDPKGAEDFYKAVLGWSTQKWGIGPFSYTMWSHGGPMPLGGVVPLPSGAQARGSHWMPYVGVADVDTAAAQARALGATVVVEPKAMAMVGRIAVLADPAGAAVAVFSPSMAVPPEPPEPQIREFSWHELATKDQAAAFAFYQALFGWEKASSFDMGPGGTYQIFARGGKNLGGIFNQAGVAQWLPYVRVADVAATAEVVTKNGGTLVRGPMEVPGGDRVAQCVDPQGAAFALHQLKPA
jgi:predicted enzyme related to lactoylglutathione lyase